MSILLGPLGLAFGIGAAGVYFLTRKNRSRSGKHTSRRHHSRRSSRTSSRGSMRGGNATTTSLPSASWSPSSLTSTSTSTMLGGKRRRHKSKKHRKH